jgi:hypothetical protein
MSIDEICEKYQIKNYTINDDGTIDVDGGVGFSGYGLEELPLNFNRVTGFFVCDDNQLTTLKGSPRWVGGWFDCDDNYLSSLEFGPEYVGNDFKCTENKLTDLFGSPKYIGGYFTCSRNENLIDSKWCTDRMYGRFYCNYTPLSSIFNNVDRHFLHAFNFYKIIKEDTVNLKRLKYVMDLYDQPIDLDEIQKYYRIV